VVPRWIGVPKPEEEVKGRGNKGKPKGEVGDGGAMKQGGGKPRRGGPCAVGPFIGAGILLNFGFSERKGGGRNSAWGNCPSSYGE